MKILLTSMGLCNDKIRKTLCQLAEKNPKKITVLAVSLPIERKNEKRYDKRLDEEFSKSKITHYTITHLKKKHSYKEIKDFDVIYMCGGNTFHYLDVVRKTGFDRLIKRFIKDEKVYFGASAGAALACPNINYAAWSRYIPDKNIPNLKNTKSLDLIDHLIMPHVDKRVRTELKSFEKRSKRKVIPLTNSQGVIFTGKDKYERI